jgi:hypothetical protein
MSSRDQLLSIISAAYPEFNQDDCTFVIEVFGQNGGFNSITSISVLDADEEEINGTFDNPYDIIMDGLQRWGAMRHIRGECNRYFHRFSRKP